MLTRVYSRCDSVNVFKVRFPEPTHIRTVNPRKLAGGPDISFCGRPPVASQQIVSLYLASVTAFRDLDQRSSEIRESAGIEDLDTRVALPVEGGGAWGAGLRSIHRGIEPQAQVVSMDPSGHGTQ